MKEPPLLYGQGGPQPWIPNMENEMSIRKDDNSILPLTSNETFALVALGFLTTMGLTAALCIYRPEIWVELQVSFWEWQPYLWTGLALAWLLLQVAELWQGWWQ